jgi:hypothetical protein
MSNETSYNKLTLAIATAMIVMTVSVGYQLAQPAVAQAIKQEINQAVH